MISVDPCDRQATQSYHMTHLKQIFQIGYFGSIVEYKSIDERVFCTQVTSNEEEYDTVLNRHENML